MMDESSYIMRMSLGIGILLLIVLAIALPLYQHERPAADCSQPFIYPICERADTPAPIAAAPTWLVFLSIAGTAAAAIILTYVSYHSCVIEQANIVTPTADATKAPPQPASQSLQQVSQPVSPVSSPQSSHSGASAAPSATLSTPAPPTAKPQSGVNAKSLV